jgi:hypothetical protein
MNEKMLLLERSIASDLDAIEAIYESLAGVDLEEATDQETTIVVAYRLHNLYNAFENVFRNVAEAFENTLDDRERWHSQLLQRMLLDLSPVRPAVIDEPAYDKLDELLRFRHLFRSAYGAKLDPERLALVLRKARELRSLYRPRIEQFVAFVREL